MGTRCNVIFTEAEDPRKWKSADHTILYQHDDGYPDGMLPFLAKFVPTFMKYRGWYEIDHMSAQCLTQLVIERRRILRRCEIRSAKWDRKYHNKKLNAIKKGKESMDNFDYHLKQSKEAYQRLRVARDTPETEITNYNDVLGHCINDFVAGDAEYVYVVAPTGVFAYDTHNVFMSDNIEDSSKWKSLLNKREAKKCFKEGYLPPRYREDESEAA